MRLKISKSNLKTKKYKAEFFKENEKVKTTHFGAKGMSDYIENKDKMRRTNYRKRHKKDLRTNDPTRAGYLSYYILWGSSTDLILNIKKYKSKFNFK